MHTQSYAILSVTVLPGRRTQVASAAHAGFVTFHTLRRRITGQIKVRGSTFIIESRKKRPTKETERLGIEFHHGFVILTLFYTFYTSTFWP